MRGGEQCLAAKQHDNHRLEDYDPGTTQISTTRDWGKKIKCLLTKPDWEAESCDARLWDCCLWDWPGWDLSGGHWSGEMREMRGEDCQWWWERWGEEENQTLQTGEMRAEEQQWPGDAGWRLADLRHDHDQDWPECPEQCWCEWVWSIEWGPLSSGRACCETCPGEWETWAQCIHPCWSLTSCNFESKYNLQKNVLFVFLNSPLVQSSLSNQRTNTKKDLSEDCCWESTFQLVADWTAETGESANYERDPEFEEILSWGRMLWVFLCCYEINLIKHNQQTSQENSI